jgi:hypothetical protein
MWAEAQPAGQEQVVRLVQFVKLALVALVVR